MPYSYQTITIRMPQEVLEALRLYEQDHLSNSDAGAIVTLLKYALIQYGYNPYSFREQYDFHF